MTSFGRYELLSRLANGGMGEVWLASLRGASGFEKRVVIKIMLPHVAENPKLVEMFIAEASVAAQLSHPNIIQIYELGVVSGRYFIAMEYVAGRSLRQLGHQLRKLGRQMPIWFLLAVIGKTCQGLHYAHELCDPSGRPMGLAHRDVSPENIMVSFTGDVKLIDFGALRVSTGNTHPASRKEDLVGKFSYMAPEQVRGVPANRGTDLYSVGEVLYEYLTGVRPYEAPDEASLLHKVARGEIIDPRQIAPHLPDELLDILRHVLAFDPKQRWTDAADLAEALLSLLKDANLPFDQSSIGLFLATSFPDAQDVPKVVQQELARRTLPERDLAVEGRLTRPLRVPKRRSRDSEDSVQIELEDFADNPTDADDGAGEDSALSRPTAPRDWPTPTPTAPLARPAPAPELGKRTRPQNTPAMIAAALPPPLPPIPRVPASTAARIAAPAPPPATDLLSGREGSATPGSWPMASPSLDRPGMNHAQDVAAPPAQTPEGTEDRAETPRLLDHSWPLFARGGPRTDQATASVFESATAPRPAVQGGDVFAAHTPRASEPSASPGPRDVASLFGNSRRTQEVPRIASPTEAASGSDFQERDDSVVSGLSDISEVSQVSQSSGGAGDSGGSRSAGRSPWPTLGRAPTNDSERHIDRGMELLKARSFEAALVEWERAFVLDPDNRKLRSNLRRLRKKLGRE